MEQLQHAQDAAFQEITVGRVQPPPGSLDAETLSLVDSVSVESNTFVERHAGKVAGFADLALRDLNLVVAYVLGRSSVRNSENPLGPNVYVRALLRAAEDCELHKEAWDFLSQRCESARRGSTDRPATARALCPSRCRRTVDPSQPGRADLMRRAGNHRVYRWRHARRVGRAGGATAVAGTPNRPGGRRRRRRADACAGGGGRACSAARRTDPAAVECAGCGCRRCRRGVCAAGPAGRSARCSDGTEFIETGDFACSPAQPLSAGAS
jgi:hypothetical protein